MGICRQAVEGAVQQGLINALLPDWILGQLFRRLAAEFFQTTALFLILYVGDARFCRKERLLVSIQMITENKLKGRHVHRLQVTVKILRSAGAVVQVTKAADI